MKPHIYTVGTNPFLVGHTKAGEKESFWEQHNIKLPPGTYQLIGLAAELTEEQKKKICVPVKRPSEPVYYKLYNEPEDEQGDTPVATTDVNRAFISLLRSHNLKPETTVVIKEIKK